MKNAKLLTALIFLTLFIISGCKNPNSSKTDTQSTEITSDEKEVIKKAISGRIEEIIKGVKELNVEAAAKPYSNDSEFMIVNPDASVTDFQTMKNVQREGFKALKSMNFTTIKQHFMFLTKDLVMYTWTGKNEFELNTGEKMKIEPYVGSMLFRNEDKEWKIIYVHETSVPPVSVK